MSLNLRPRKRHVPLIPIVSLIDIMVILLIFFIATTTFRRQKHSVEISLPKSSSMGAVESKAAIERTAIAVNKDNQIFLNGEELPADALASRLKAMREANPGSKIEFQGDGKMDYDMIFTVWDALRSAGFSINDVPVQVQRAVAK